MTKPSGGRYLTCDSDLCAPVLLQQLLRSMESYDTSRSAAITYAVLSLLIRLLASQSSVFNLWFSRRCYERSRGEMITMLYEKTLSRKIIGNPRQEAVSPDKMNYGSPPRETERPRSQMGYILESLYGAVRSLFGKKMERPNESKRPASASLGKVLNLMRHALLAVLPSYRN